jgi:hypothetical protein
MELSSISVVEVTEGAASLQPAAATRAQDADATLKMAVLLLEGLSRNVMSGDVWALSQMYACRRAEQVGMTPDLAAEALDRLMVMVHANRKGNPLSSMF